MDIHCPKIKTGIIGSGNIGTDLMLKLLKSSLLRPHMEVGIDENSKGLSLAKEKGVKTSAKGIDDLLKEDDIKIVFDATSAQAHLKHAPLLKKAGKIAIDLTPAAIGPYVVPNINLNEHLDKKNVNLITCGAQATIPIVYAISQVAKVEYAEIVSSIASKSAGPGTRQNIDEFTKTTASSLEKLGEAKKGKALIILNPAEPPITMQNTIYTIIESGNWEKVFESIGGMVKKIQSYVPGYKLKHKPVIDGKQVTVQIQVEGAGDYLPEYSGNLDIITAAAVAVGEEYAKKILKKN